MLNKSAMLELFELVTQWGKDRKIITNGKVATQILKFNEEIGEFFEGKSPETTYEQLIESMKDAIGDSLVVLTMINGIVNDKNESLTVFTRVLDNNESILSILGSLDSGSKLKDNSSALHAIMAGIFETTGVLSGITARDKIEDRKDEFNKYLGMLYSYVIALSDATDLDVIECYQMAYDEIKDRKGELLPNGNFVKEEDLKKN